MQDKEDAPKTVFNEVLQGQGINDFQEGQSEQKKNFSQKFPNPNNWKSFLKLLKIPVIILVLVLFFALLISWFGRKGVSKPSLSVSGTVEIEWWGVQHQNYIYKDLIDEYERNHPNVKINYSQKDLKGYRERLTNSFLQAKGPDIFEVHNSWVPMFANNLARIPEEVIGKEDFKKSFYPIIVSDLSWNNEFVGIPLEYDALTLFINQDIFSLSLRNPPERWDELRDLAYFLTQKDKRNVITQSGLAIGAKDNVEHWPEILGLILFQNKVNPARPSGELASSSFSFFTSFGENQVWGDTLPPSSISFARGRLAMFFGTTRDAVEIIRQNPSLKFKTVKLPQVRKDKPDDPDVSYSSYWFMGVWNGSKKAQVAFDFLKFLSSKDSLLKLSSNLEKYELVPKAFPRPEMNASLREHPIVGSVVLLAPFAKTFYLHGNLFDGEKGINTQINNLYKKALSSSGFGLKDLGGSIIQVLASFGVRK